MTSQSRWAFFSIAFFLSLTVSCFFLPVSGLAWPWDKPKKTEEKKPAPPAKQAPAKQAGNEQDKSKGTKTKTTGVAKIVEKSEVKTVVRQVPAPSKLKKGTAVPEDEEVSLSAEEQAQALLDSIPKVPKIPVIPTSKTSAGKVNPVIPGKATAGNANEDPAAKVKGQIQEILKVNDQLKNQYRDQSVAIQKVMDQAKIHQQILKDLEVRQAQVKKQQAVQMIDPKEVLRQEKIRLIEEQTKVNQAFLNQLTGGQAGSSAAKTSGNKNSVGQAKKQ